MTGALTNLGASAGGASLVVAHILWEQPHKEWNRAFLHAHDQRGVEVVVVLGAELGNAIANFACIVSYRELSLKRNDQLATGKKALVSASLSKRT